MGMNMKHPKPGFRAFIRTRIRHPLTGSLDLIYTDEAGIMYKGKGSNSLIFNHRLRYILLRNRGYFVV